MPAARSSAITESIRFPAGVTVFTGLALTIVYLLLPSGHPNLPPFDVQDLIEVATLNALTLFGALYARQVQAEQDRLNVAVEEKDALLNVSQVVTSCDKLEYALNSALLLLRPGAGWLTSATTRPWRFP